MRALTISRRQGLLESRRIRRAYLYLRRASRMQVVLLLSALFLGVLLVGLLGYMFFLDLAQSGKIFPGMTIDGRPVGGLSRTAATEFIKRSIATPLNQPVTLYYDEREVKLDPRTIGLAVDTGEMVNASYWTGQSQNIVPRMFRRFFNEPLHENVPVMVKYDKAKLKQFIAGVAQRLDYPPRSSSIDMSKGSPKIRPSRYGLTVKQDESIKAISTALSKHSRRIPLVTVSVKPQVTEAEINKIIVIKQGEHKLYLYDGETLDDEYTCAVGSPQYPTPTGKFYITAKEKNPTWVPPKSAWVKDPRPVPPGPGNPLGPYWMDLGGGLGIHSTPDEKSLGYSVSHGCIRVSEWSALQIFDEVKRGTPVYILP